MIWKWFSTRGAKKERRDAKRQKAPPLELETLEARDVPSAVGGLAHAAPWHGEAILGVSPGTADRLVSVLYESSGDGTSGAGPFFGRPRWEASTSRAFAFSRCSRVLNDARMRVSSLIAPLSRGTL